MQRYHDCPQVLREFLIYHENIKGQSPLTISEYYLDLRMFLRFIKLMRNDMPMSTYLDDIDIKEIVREVHQISGVDKLHHIHVWYLNEEELHLEAHLDCSEDIKISEFNAILHQIEEVLSDKFHINHINIQPEYNREEASKDFIVQD